MSAESTTRKSVKSLAICTTPLWLLPLAQWLAYQRSLIVSLAGWMLLNAELLFFLVFLWIVALLLVSPVLLWFAKYRRRALGFGLQSTIFLASLYWGALSSHTIWRYHVAIVARNAEPLIDAIDDYVAEEGKPPHALDDLVPDHMTVIPKTGIGLFPEFRYVANEPERYDGNPWVLTVTPPCLMMGFDQILYFPLQNYPEHGYGGVLERIGNWAYVHE